MYMNLFILKLALPAEFDHEFVLKTGKIAFHNFQLENESFDLLKPRHFIRFLKTFDHSYFHLLFFIFT